MDLAGTLENLQMIATIICVAPIVIGCLVAIIAVLGLLYSPIWLPIVAIRKLTK